MPQGFLKTVSARFSCAGRTRAALKPWSFRAACCRKGRTRSPLAAEFRRQTGIDAQVHEVLFERRHNAGTRKRKVFVPVLVFKVTAKSPNCKPSAEFSGYKWLERAGLTGYRRAKNCLWL